MPGKEEKLRRELRKEAEKADARPSKAKLARILWKANKSEREGK